MQNPRARRGPGACCRRHRDNNNNKNKNKNSNNNNNNRNLAETVHAKPLELVEGQALVAVGVVPRVVRVQPDEHELHLLYIYIS